MPNFEFPYPMGLNFNVSSHSFENAEDEERVKIVTDSVSVRGADLNSAKVRPYAASVGTQGNP